MPNGIRVVTDRVMSVRSVALGLWLACGSRQDEELTTGTAHFIEHMLFKGTLRRTAKQLALEADRIGGQLNALTSVEYTCYYIKTLDEYVDKAFDLLSDMFFNSLFAHGEIRKEKRVISQEYDMHEDDPEELAQNIFLSSVWEKHPLSRNITGTKGHIRRITRSVMDDFRQDFYTPDNLVVAAAGRLEHDEVCRYVDKYLAVLKGQKRLKTGTVPIFKGGCKAVDKPLEQLQIVWGVPGITLSEEDWPAAIILNNVLGGGASSRLFQEMREDKGLVYFVYSGFSSYSDTGLFTVNAGVKPKNGGAFLTALADNIKELAENGITEDELKNAKQHINSEWLLALEGTGGRMQRIGRLAAMNLPLLSVEEVLDKIAGTSLADVAAMSARLFKDAEPAVVMLGPKNPVPGARGVRRNL